MKRLKDGEPNFTPFLSEFGEDGKCIYKMVGDYTVKRDTIIYFTYTVFTNKIDFPKPVTTISIKQEKFVIRRNSECVPVSIQFAEKKNALWYDIAQKLSKQISKMDEMK